ncbi:MAG: cupin 2 domain-containing protein [Phenylobacterium sp.]|jgi:cupin 2 domain-containing protein
MNNNIFDNIPQEIPKEIFEDIIKTDNMKIERIVSHGQSSPDYGWYECNDNEWVMVLQGKAKLRFHSNNELVELNPGSHIEIKAGVRHKVEWTSPDEKTVWLAVYY